MSEKSLNNNEILKKVTISHNLRRADILEIFELAGFMLSYNQVGAYMLKSDNRRFMPIEDDLLEAFLNKLIDYSRGTKEQPHIPPRSILNSIINLAERDLEDALDNIADCVEEARRAMHEAREQEEDEDGEEEVD
ncbi:MAG: DUF1456 family protein [Lentisphaeraceae bacterium]|nr:DUF1456 family protein [Lentisphaeraceae bacterium]